MALPATKPVPLSSGTMDESRPCTTRPGTLACSAAMSATARETREAIRSAVRDQCQAAGCRSFFQQWGGRAPTVGGRELDGRPFVNDRCLVGRAVSRQSLFQLRSLESPRLENGCGGATEPRSNQRRSSALEMSHAQHGCREAMHTEALPARVAIPRTRGRCKRSLNSTTTRCISPVLKGTFPMSFP